MAEILVSAVSEALIGKLIAMAANEISLVRGVRDEMSRLERTLCSIHAVLVDAERQQIQNEAVKLWLRNLKDAVYEAEDILDELEYQSLRYELEFKGCTRNKVRNFFSRSNPLGFRCKMAHRIKDLNQRLDQVSKDKNNFSLNYVTETNNTMGSSRDRETFSLIDASMFVGREKDKSGIIDLLLESSNNQQIYRIILIVAMGGVGKTALTQIIYCSDAVEKHFEKRVWVCVSDYSNRLKVFNQLVESISGKKKDYSSLDVMVSILKEELQNQRYLIVLDDMWNDEDNEWDSMLQTLLFISSEGSKVIITSRSHEVVTPMSILYRYNLAGLSENDCWTMLEKIAFGPQGLGKTTNFINIGKNIAKKCGGMPLTTKFLGRLMYLKKSEHDWRLIENNEIWNLPAGEMKVIKVLKLSYDHLQPHLKQCFRYCSLFQKDYSISRNHIIRLWMAEGFLGHSINEMETLGNEYFNSLVSDSFFEEEKTNEFGVIKSCKMHDLVHDLAQSLAKSESSINIVNKIGDEDISGLRRVSLVSEKNDFSGLPTTQLPTTQLTTTLVKSKKLRAFISARSLFIGNSYATQIFMKFSNIRVLDLRHNSITDLPPSIGKLKHLRYLNLSHSSELRELPNSITTLYNLQTLILKKCYWLRVLPKDMRKLTKLRHLILDEYSCPILRKVKSLTSLTYLPVFVVGNKNEGFGIQELGDMNLLSGKLQIYNLGNISSGKDAEGGGIKGKQHILRLELHWREITDSIDIRDDFQVLEGLQPHQNLRRLGIYNYVSSKFPAWATGTEHLLPNLVYVVLKNCKNCEYLPPLGLLPFLKVLQIEGLNAVKSIGSEFYGSNNMIVSSFPSLESITMRKMDDLVEWSDQVSTSSSSSSFSSFPRLEELTLVDCPQLTLMPIRFPSLKTSCFQNCNGKSIGPLLESNRSSLTSINIIKCHELVFFVMGLLRGNNILCSLQIQVLKKFQGFNPNIDFLEGDEDKENEYPNQVIPNNSLNELTLVDCGPLDSCLLDLRGFNSLRKLYIGEIQKCVKGIEHLPKLETLIVGSCFKFMSSFPFPDPNIEDESGAVIGNYFPSLRELRLQAFKYLPDQIQYMTSLQTLQMNWWLCQSGWVT